MRDDGNGSFGSTADQTPEVPTPESVFAQRSATYGDARQNHTQLGLAWTALLQSHYRIELPHPIPPHVVALMMCNLKILRASLPEGGGGLDDFVDLHVYAKIGEEIKYQGK